MNENKTTLRKFLQRTWQSIDWQEVGILALIFIGSFLIRSIGLKHGFPLLDHPDERVSIDPVVEMTRNRTLNPGTFNRPQQVSYFFYFIYLNLISYLRFGTNLAVAFPKHVINFYFYTRITIAVLGSLIPVVAYKIGKLFKNSFAVPAALVFALFPSYALHSLFMTPDVPITFLSLLVMYFTIRYLNKQDEKAIYIAAVFAAINTAEKYPGLISLGIVFLGLALKHFDPKEEFTRGKIQPFLVDALKIIGVFILALFFFAPFLFIKFQQAISAFTYEARSSHLAADNLSWFGNMLFYIRSFGSWTNVLSILGIGLGILGISKAREKSYFILFFGILYWILVSVLSLHWERWALPMYISPLFLTAVGIEYAQRKSRDIPVLKYLSMILLIGFLLYQFIFTVHIPIKQSFTDTRVESLRYCNENGITKENALYEGYTPLSPSSVSRIIDVSTKDLETHDYIIISSRMYDRFYREPQRYKEAVDFYENVQNNQVLLAQFDPEKPPANIVERADDILYYIKSHFGLTDEVRYKGPTIKIFRIVDRMTP